MGNSQSRRNQQAAGTAPAQPSGTPGGTQPVYSGSNTAYNGPGFPAAYRPQVNYYGQQAPTTHYPYTPPGPRPQFPPQPMYPLTGPGRSGSTGAAAAPQPSPQALTKTATIRNAVNLKKNTLRLEPVPGDPQKLRIMFSFDNSAPCTASTFVAATEEPAQGSRITSASQPILPGIHYEKGLGLKFPRDGAEVAGQHVVDLSTHSVEALSSGAGNTYPLIIRLETVTERGAKDGHTLQELEAGGAQKQWVQSQTTFAALVKNEDGEFEVRVLKQKIWVDGISYELQEIYGMDQAGSDRRAEMTEAEAEDRLCVICLVNERDTTVLPCRHMCMCHECAQELRKQTQRCPVCRAPVESLLHIRLGKSSGTAAAVAAAAAAAGGSVKGGAAPAPTPAPAPQPAAIEVA